jgi:hypothetical protein
MKLSIELLQRLKGAAVDRFPGIFGFKRPLLVHDGKRCLIVPLVQ